MAQAMPLKNLFQPLPVILNAEKEEAKYLNINIKHEYAEPVLTTI